LHAMSSMRLLVLAAITALATGCGAYYEDVPAFGESDPNAAVVDQRPDNPTQLQAEPRQEVMASTATSLDAAPADDYADTDPSALTDFRSTLDPYGNWVDDSSYGTVWQPDASVVGADFEPYVTNGHWTYDDDQYTWASDFDWGWAPFHYGRWVYVGGRGWCWIPGRRYAGAWVDWRVGDPGYGYIGWGPLAPTWYWRDGMAYDIGWDVDSPYVFCGTGDLFAPSLRGRILAGPRVRDIGRHTRPYRNGRTAANPTVGPSPSRYGMMPPSRVPATPGVIRARAFAHASSAIALGAHPPARTFAHPSGAAGARSSALLGADRPVVTAPRFNGVRPSPLPYGSMRSRTIGEPYGAYRMPPAYRGSPVYRGGSAYRGAPFYRGGPAYRGPVYRGAPAYRGGGPAYRGGGPAYRSAPAYRGGGPAYRGGGPAYRGGGPAYRGGGAATPPPPSHSYRSGGGGGSHFSGHFGGRGFGGFGRGGGGGGHRR
jgi:hypothetical protein